VYDVGDTAVKDMSDYNSGTAAVEAFVDSLIPGLSCCTQDSRRAANSRPDTNKEAVHPCFSKGFQTCRFLVPDDIEIPIYFNELVHTRVVESAFFS
jgi:hypothetical protein